MHLNVIICSHKHVPKCEKKIFYDEIIHIEHSSLYAFQLTQVLSFATNINQPWNT